MIDASAEAKEAQAPRTSRAPLSNGPKWPLDMLKFREAAAPPPAKRRATRPTRGSKERRLSEKKRRGETKRGRQGRFD